jgi:hypothetical protein
MTLPKGFKPKVDKRDKKEESSKTVGSKEDNNKIDSSDVKVTAATASSFVNKNENKILTDNIPPKQEVAVDDIRMDEGSALITATTTTPTPEGVVESQTELNVPLEEKERKVESQTELKVMSSSSSSRSVEEQERKEPRSIANTVTNTTSSPTKSIDDYGEGINNKENETIVSSSQVLTPSPQVQHQKEEQQYAVNRSLDETKDNIKKTTDQARKDIPRYTQAVGDYQEQTIQAAREIADNYIESQREIINSVQSAWLPQVEAANRAFISSWISPRRLADNYARVVSSFADNTIAATRVINNAIFANLEVFKTSVQNTRDNVKEWSRVGVNAARSFEQVSRDNTAAATTISSGYETSSFA